MDELKMSRVINRKKSKDEEESKSRDGVSLFKSKI